MLKTIQALIELQSIDDEIHAHSAQRDELEANLKALRGIVARMAEELEDKRDKVTEASRFYEDKQEDLRLDGERLNKAKQKLTAVTRTKEYAAMQREIDTLRRKFSEDETELKRLAEAIEEYHVSIGAQEQKLSDLEAEVRREEAASDERLGELDQLIAEIDKRKGGIKVGLDRPLVSRYKRVLARREGKAVVPAIDGNCTGCQMRLPPQQFILVQRGEELQVCPACQRFLYIPPETASE